MNDPFNQIVPRDKDSLKYCITPEKVREAGYMSFSAAEMDFPTAPSIIKSVTEMVQRGIFGFTLMTDEYKERVIWWMKNARDWEINPDWIVPTMGTIYSVATAIRMTTTEGEGVIVQNPGYHRYAQAAQRLHRKVVVSHLKEEDGRYTMDFESLEKCMADPQNKLLVLCNPNNPTARVWTREELTEVGRLAAKYEVIVFSDEIFAEVTFDGHRTVPFLEIQEGLSQAIVCTSLGKCFNFTGVNHANVLIADEKLRERFITQRNADHYGSLEPFAYASVMGAYTPEGLKWKNEMTALVDENRKKVMKAFAEEFAPNYVFPIEGTYVCWIHWRGIVHDGTNLKDFLVQEALLALDGGLDYDDECRDYCRMNLATTREQMDNALDRLRRALKKQRNSSRDM